MLTKAIDVLCAQIVLNLNKDSTYADKFLHPGQRRLVKSLGLEPAQESALFQTLRESQETIEKLNSLSWVDDDIVEEKVGTKTAEADAAIRQLLGDKYATYKELEGTYEMTDLLDGRLEPAARLSDQQANRLARLIQRVYSEHPLADQEEITPDEQSAANIRALKRREALIDQEAGTFLTPEQVDAIFPFREP